MREWLYKLGCKFRTFMIGRYGYDPLSRLLVIGGWIVTLVGSFSRLTVVYYIGDAIILWGMFRVFSKNISQRQKELNSYYRIRFKLSGTFGRVKSKFKSLKNHEDTKNYIYLNCAQCGTRMRVPKGKGTIIVTCPSCRNKRTMYS